LPDKIHFFARGQGQELMTREKLGEMAKAGGRNMKE
jgi:hypothetical protein